MQAPCSPIPRSVDQMARKDLTSSDFSSSAPQVINILCILFKGLPDAGTTAGATPNEGHHPHGRFCCICPRFKCRPAEVFSSFQQVLVLLFVLLSSFLCFFRFFLLWLPGFAGLELIFLRIEDSQPKRFVPIAGRQFSDILLVSVVFAILLDLFADYSLRLLICL